MLRSKILPVIIGVGWLIGPAKSVGSDIVPYPNAEVFRMGEKLLVNGQKANIYYFMTQAKPKQVIDFYKKQWEERGMIVVVHEQAQPISVASYDMKNDRSLSVACFRQGEWTFAIPSSVEGVLSPFAQPSENQAELPIPNTAQALVTHQSQDRDAMFSTYAYFETRTPKDALRFWLQEMGERGFHLSERQEQDSNVWLVFSKPELLVRVTLTGVFQPSGTSVFVVSQHSNSKTD